MQIFTQFFRLLSDDCQNVTFPNFKRFLKDMQKEDIESKDFDYRAGELIRRYDFLFCLGGSTVLLKNLQIPGWSIDAEAEPFDRTFTDYQSGKF